MHYHNKAIKFYSIHSDNDKKTTHCIRSEYRFSEASLEEVAFFIAAIAALFLRWEHVL